MNKFENEIFAIVPSSDWNDYRQNVKQVVRKYLECASASAVFRDNPDISKTTVQVLIFEYDGIRYLWVDTLVDGKLNGAQLEKAISEYSSEILYSSSPKNESVAMYALVINLIKQGKLKKME